MAPHSSGEQNPLLQFPTLHFPFPLNPPPKSHRFSLPNPPLLLPFRRPTHRPSTSRKATHPLLRRMLCSPHRCRVHHSRLPPPLRRPYQRRRIARTSLS
ncbi:hypothetical protein LINPERHAP1_LOCUS4186 [Linum perenne]